MRGCNLDEPLYRDVANFVMRHAVPKEELLQPIISQPASESSVGPASTNTPVGPSLSQPDAKEYANETNGTDGADNFLL
ncbi:MAG: hypothetical protein VYE35_08045, partial [Chloroflexota bacterium]|nr:hypothetical protein [Chloroflexota bacterium]